MTETDELITDEMLTAYLDGELDAAVHADIDAIMAVDEALCARLAALDLPLDHLRAVMAPRTLAAPALPEGLLQSNLRAANAPGKPGLRRLWIPTAIAASFVAGLMIAPFFAAAPPGPAPAKWVEAVASYQALYVTATLAVPPQDAGVTAEILAQAAAEFDVTLAPAVQVEGLDFKRAQMLGWHGKPLLQLAYLDGDGTPMALCLTRVGAEDRGPKPSTSHNLTGVSWVKNGVGYFLIGGDNPARVDALSQQVITSL